MNKKRKRSLSKKINDISFGNMLWVIYFSVTLFLVNCLNKFKGTNLKMYIILLLISILWILSLGSNIISAAFTNENE